MILKYASRQAYRLVKEYQKASIERSEIGGGDPLDSPGILIRYKRAKKKLLDYIARLEREK